VLQVTEKAKLRRKEEKQGSSLFAGSCGSSNTVNVLPWVIRRIILNNPVNSGNIKTTGSDISAEKNPSLSIDEFKECVGALLLLLLSLKGWEKRKRKRKKRRKTKLVDGWKERRKEKRVHLHEGLRPEDRCS
jgi:hypothetical protein